MHMLHKFLILNLFDHLYNSTPAAIVKKVSHKSIPNLPTCQCQKASVISLRSPM